MCVYSNYVLMRITFAIKHHITKEGVLSFSGHAHLKSLLLKVEDPWGFLYRQLLVDFFIVVNYTHCLAMSRTINIDRVP